jgi:DNA modification methylase
MTIEPYYEEPGIVIYNADCRDVLPQLEPVDLVLTDPPYGLNTKMNGGTWGTAYRRGDMLKWDYVVSDEDIKKIIKSGLNQIIWGGNNYSLPPSRCWLVWKKPHLPTLSDVELAWTNFDAPSKVYCEKREQHNGHPTAKPLSLMKWCLGFAPDAQTILDPFMGSGTTLVAAKFMGMRCIGIEIEERYCSLAVDRLRQGILPFTEKERITTGGIHK